VENVRLCTGCGAALPADTLGDVCKVCDTKADRAPRGTVVVTPSHFSPHTAPNESIPLGVRRFGAYQLIRPLGQGGMGSVYEAEEGGSGRRVALKVLHNALDSKEARQRFLREGRLAASVNHPNSVYIFGAEEIEGQPVIAMELIGGGTLQERVQQKGPMAVAEAVEAILDVIAGLEAAADLGVLHRDIKPSNCFIDADGTVKIGDFGLSKSTGGPKETELTLADSFLGTPAFCSPEQLRGDEITVASDIYAVGVTLYYLLTGHLPFESDNMVRLLAMAIERAPEPPSKWRPDLPGPLNRIVLRCLAKQPAQRFKSYADLRRVLAPFSKVAPSPATLGLRLVAGIIDKLLPPAVGALFYWALAYYSIVMESGLQSARVGAAVLGGMMLARIFYFAIPEHLWGASIGKLICDLRVVDTSRSFPGWGKAFLRAAVYVLVPNIPGAIYAMFFAKAVSPLLHPWAFAGNSDIVIALMFIGARRANGFAALHDWLTATRVIERSAYQVHRPLAEQTGETSEPRCESGCIGPYEMVRRIQETEHEEWLLGMDVPLSRTVWIRKFKTPNPPALDPALRNLNRPGRLRWLNGRRGAAENWDAFEALSGKPLVDLIRKRQPWSAVRLWTLDLAQELDAATKTGPLPQELALDRVWVTGNGHAKLLDFPPPGSPVVQSPGQPPQIIGDIEARRFIIQAAFSALEGRALSPDEAFVDRTIAAPLPLHGREFFNGFMEFIDLGEIAETLSSLTHRAAVVSRQRKLAVLASCALPVMLLAGMLSFGLLLARESVGHRSEAMKVENCLNKLDELNKPGAKDDPAQRAALETYIAAGFPKVKFNVADGPLPIQVSISTNLVKLGEEVVARHPVPSSAEVARAETALGPVLKGDSGSVKKLHDPRLFLWFIMGSLLLLPAAAVISAALVRRGVVLRVARVEIVTSDGAPARRCRLLCRSVLIWTPMVIAVGFELTGQYLAAIGLGAVFVAGVVTAIVTPDRSIADRLMGTWLTPV